MNSETLNPQSWVIRFLTHPEGIEKLPQGRGPGTKNEANRLHYQVCLERFKTILIPGLTITGPETDSGYVFIEGAEELCLEFKAIVEKDDWAVMTKNDERVQTCSKQEDN